MRNPPVIAALLMILLSGTAMAEKGTADPSRDILVTFSNEGASAVGSGSNEPYRKRKRYSIGAQARRDASDVANDYALVEIDGWPIRSLSIFCFVYRVPPGISRNDVLDQLRADPRVESAQLVQRFETVADRLPEYDDTYASLQRGLDVMDVSAAHRYSRGQGVRIAIIDSHADANHEDLNGRVTATHILADPGKPLNGAHGTAVASVIGANAENARGIVGIAPDSEMEVYVACWAEHGTFNAVCDSFTLAKALDALLRDTADILNMSLVGPYDPLLARMLTELERSGVVIVAAQPAEGSEAQRFPASLEGVIAVDSSDGQPAPGQNISTASAPLQVVRAPSEQIMVAVPGDAYDFRSGTSLSAAHVSGVVALLLAVSPNMQREIVQRYLLESQRVARSAPASVNACVVLRLADPSRQCRADAFWTANNVRTRTSH